MAAACAMVLAMKAEAEEEEKDPGDGRDPDTSRRRFRPLRYGDVSGPEEALSRRRELCRRWLWPERRSKEQMLELLVLEQFLRLLPRRLRDSVRRRRPRAGKRRRPGRAPCTRPPRRAPRFKAKAGSPTQGEWQQLAAAPQNGLCKESIEDYGSTAVPGLENQATWNPNLIQSRRRTARRRSSQRWPGYKARLSEMDPNREERLPKDAVLPLPQPQGSPEEPGRTATTYVPFTPKEEEFWRSGEPGHTATSQALCGVKEEELWRSGEPGRTAISQVPCGAKAEGLWRSDFEEVATALALAQDQLRQFCEVVPTGERDCCGEWSPAHLLRLLL
nr:zinc finger protein 394-like [Meriones unguiculatus]